MGLRKISHIIRFRRKWRIASLWDIILWRPNKKLEEHVDKYSGQKEKPEGKVLREQATTPEKD
jgi:hypothetical protein